MKTLKPKFEKNVDKAGKMTFTQVKRDGDVALYERTRADGTHFNYEVFIVKQTFAGAKLPGGAVEKEDRECYPGANSFGRTAYDCLTIDHAEDRFDQLVTRSKDISDAREKSVVTGKVVRAKKAVKVSRFDLNALTDVDPMVDETATETVVPDDDEPKVRNRKVLDRSTLKFPTGEWTMKQAHALNPDVCHATVWSYSKQLVKSGQLIVCGTKSGGRGKPTLLYRFPTENEVAEVTVDVPVPVGDEPF
jgi:hypothetical protein